MKTIIAEFKIINGQEKNLLAACEVLLKAVADSEDGTWLYLINTRQGKHSKYLVFFESYANEEAFERHLAADTPWARFSQQALKNGWLVADSKNPTGFKTKFSPLQNLGSVVRSSGKVGS